MTPEFRAGTTPSAPPQRPQAQQAPGPQARLDPHAVAAGLLIALNGLYMLLVAFGNITDYDSNRAFVQHVLAMDTTNFGSPAGTGLDPHVMWRSITTPWVQTAAYIGIIAWETAAAAVLVAATIAWTRGRSDGYRRAQRYSCAGLLMIIILFVGGFICVGGEWFAMYRSTAWNGLDPAFRNSVLAVLTLIVCLTHGSRLFDPARREGNVPPGALPAERGW